MRRCGCSPSGATRARPIRAVAGSAGVASGLVSHHFGSKQGLRDACDAYVLDYLRWIIKEGVGEQGLADPAYVGDVYQSAADVLRYVAKALVDGSAAAATLFDNLVALTEDYLSRSTCPRGASEARSHPCGGDRGDAPRCLGAAPASGAGARGR